MKQIAYFLNLILTFENKILSILFFGTLMSSFSIAAEGTKAQIRLGHEVEVSAKEKYTLYDLVELQSAPQDLILALKSTTVPVDSSGSLSISLPRQKWTEIFKTADLARFNPQYTIPETVLIRPKSFFSESEFNRKIKNQLSSLCGDCQFEVNASSKIQMNSLRNQKSLNWNLDLSGLQKIQSSIVVKMDTSDQTLWVPIQVKAYKSVPVASKNLLSISKALESDDYSMQTRDIASVSSTAMTPAQFTKMTLAQSVSQGAILTESQFRKAVVIKKGQMVKVFLSEDDFQITLQASAEESGSVGDVIKIKTVGTNKLLSAQIQSDQTLVVK